MTHSFNLLQNPLVLFGLSPSASNQDIVEAFEDASVDERAPETVLAAAKQNLLDPKFRLNAELSSLLDTPAEKAQAAIAALRRPGASVDVTSIQRNLGSLSRLNFLCHLASHQKRPDDSLRSIVECRARIQYDELAQLLTATREAAGLRGPPLDAIRKSFDAIFDQHLEALFASYPDAEAAAKDLLACTTPLLAEAQGDRVDALDLLTKGYRRSFEAERARCRGAIQSAATALRQDPSNAARQQELLSALGTWERLDRPLQLLEQHKGRDDTEARQLFDDVRSLALTLANDLDRFDLALKISNASAAAFAGLPRASAKVDEDITILQDRIAAQGASKLLRFLDDIDDDLNRLSVSVREYGFKRGAHGPAGELFVLFVDAVMNTRGTSAADRPWLILRQVAIRLNNDASSPQAAAAVLEGIIHFSESERPSADVVKALDADFRIAKRNALEKTLVQNLETKDTRAALTAVRALLPVTDDREQRGVLQNLESKLATKRVGSYIRYIIFAAIGLFVLIGIISENGHRPSYAPSSIPEPQPSYSPDPTPTSAPYPPVLGSDFGETMPPIGSGLNFTRSNIRYCLFQKARLEYARPAISDSTQYAFNAAVDDWNARCSSYRYSPGDLPAVQGELFGKDQALRDDARDMVWKWNPPASPAPAPRATYTPSPSPTRPAPIPPQTPTPSAVALTTPVATAAPMDITPQATRPRTDLALNPLVMRDAARVQKRLIELGYLTGQPNGTWGPLTRAALRAFKGTSGFESDDGLDAQTAERLFATDAPRASGTPATRPGSGRVYTYPAPPGATLNPLNAPDAVRIHSRLRELGLYKGKNDTLWSPASREAIKKFETSKGLPTSPDWNANLERELFKDGAP